VKHRTTTTPIRRTLAAALLTAALLAPLASAQEDPQPAKPGQERLERARPLAERLGLTAEQEKALEALRQARGDESRAFRDEMAKIRDEVRALRRDPEANRAKLEALIDRGARLRADRAKSALRARSERTKIFTPEQMEKLKSLRSRALRRDRLAGRGYPGPDRMGAGRGLGLRSNPRAMARLRALRYRQILRRHRW